MMKTFTKKSILVKWFKSHMKPNEFYKAFEDEALDMLNTVGVVNYIVLGHCSLIVSFFSNWIDSFQRICVCSSFMVVCCRFEF